MHHQSPAWTDIKFSWKPLLGKAPCFLLFKLISRDGLSQFVLVLLFMVTTQKTPPTAKGVSCHHNKLISFLLPFNFSINKVALFNFIFWKRNMWETAAAPTSGHK